MNNQTTNTSYNKSPINPDKLSDLNQLEEQRNLVSVSFVLL
jgi:hypothetical protein